MPVRLPEHTDVVIAATGATESLAPLEAEPPVTARGEVHGR